MNKKFNKNNEDEDTTRITIKLKPEIHKKFKKCILEKEKDPTIQNTVESLITNYDANLQPRKYDKFHLNLRFPRKEYKKILDYITTLRNENPNQLTSEAIKREMINCFYQVVSKKSLKDQKTDSEIKNSRKKLNFPKTIKFKLNYQLAKKIENNELYTKNVLERLTFILADVKEHEMRNYLVKYLERKHLSIKLEDDDYTEFKNLLDEQGEDATVQNISKALIEEYISRTENRENDSDNKSDTIKVEF